MWPVTFSFGTVFCYIKNENEYCNTKIKPGKNLRMLGKSTLLRLKLRGKYRCFIKNPGKLV